jgi:predicted PolB exonuclease-like 3'-5' exonuclease
MGVAIKALVSNPITKIRRLFWDIETSPNIGFFWRAGAKQFVNYDSIIHERAVICICYKWEGEDDIHYLTWDKNQSDKEMLRKFSVVAAAADEMVAHNGDRFDVPWFKTRCIYHGLPTHPNYKTIDTLQWAKRNFYFNSNRMDYISKFLGFEGKMHAELDLWKRIVMKNDRKALKYMVEYCQCDVEILEKVYRKLSEHVNVKTHAGVVAGRDKWTCVRCASKIVHKNKTKITSAGEKRHQMMCGSCGACYTISAKVFADYQEAKKPLKKATPA